jgi:hypothetical protein
MKKLKLILMTLGRLIVYAQRICTIIENVN